MWKKLVPSQFSFLIFQELHIKTDTTQIHTVVDTNDLITVPSRVPGSIFSGQVYPHSFFGKVGEMRWVNVSIYTQNVTYSEKLVNTTSIELDLVIPSGTGSWVNITVHSEQFDVPDKTRSQDLSK